MSENTTCTDKKELIDYILKEFNSGKLMIPAADLVYILAKAGKVVVKDDGLAYEKE